MRILIVDDERPARDRLRRLLAPQTVACGIEAVEEAADGVDALARIAQFQPDVLLLDVDMPELSGIELAASLPDPGPLVVFVTAHDRYAIEAFERDAIDYLLKPCDPARLARTLSRLRERLRQREAVRTVQPLPNLAQDRPPLRQLVVSERGVTRIVPIDDIGWIETADNYVALHTAAGSPLLRQTLAGLLERLGPAFVRCHRRAAVRLAHIERVVALDKGDGMIVLHGGAQVPCSRQYRADVMAQLAGAAAA